MACSSKLKHASHCVFLNGDNMRSIHKNNYQDIYGLLILKIQTWLYNNVKCISTSTQIFSMCKIITNWGSIKGVAAEANIPQGDIFQVPNWRCDKIQTWLQILQIKMKHHKEGITNKQWRMKSDMLISLWIELMPGMARKERWQWVALLVLFYISNISQTN